MVTDKSYSQCGEFMNNYILNSYNHMVLFLVYLLHGLRPLKGEGPCEDFMKALEFHEPHVPPESSSLARNGCRPNLMRHLERQSQLLRFGKQYVYLC